MSAALPFAMYIAFLASWFLHLPARYTFLGSLRIDLVLVVLLLITCARMEKPAIPPSDGDQRTRALLFAIAIYALVSLPFVEWPGSVLKNGFPTFIKAVVFYYFTASLVDSPRRLRILLGVFIACQTFRVLEPVYLHVTDGYWGSRASMSGWQFMDRLSGAPNDVVNPNGLAAIVLTVVPFLHYLTLRHWGGRLVYLAVLPPLLYGLVLTGSRSGMIGFAGILALVWIKSRHKIVLTVAVAAIVTTAIPYLSADMTDRYLSIFSSKTKNSATAGERSEFMAADFRVAMRRPVFGYGLGTSKEANSNYEDDQRPAHNLYVETGQELGGIGLCIFLAFLVSLCRGVLEVGRVARATVGAAPVLTSAVQALQVWTGMNIVFSFASYGLCSYEWYFAAGLVEVSRRLIAAPVVATAPASPFPAMVPFNPRLRVAPLESQ